jgi:hypothetical protein
MYKSFEMPYTEHIAWPPGATDGCLVDIKPGTRLRMQHQHMLCCSCLLVWLSKSLIGCPVHTRLAGKRPSPRGPGDSQLVLQPCFLPAKIISRFLCLRFRPQFPLRASSAPGSCSVLFACAASGFHWEYPVQLPLQ